MRKTDNLLGGGGVKGGRGGAESYDRKKAWPSRNHSILPDTHSNVDFRLSSTDRRSHRRAIFLSSNYDTNRCICPNITEPLNGRICSCQVQSLFFRRIGLAKFSATLFAQYVYKTAQTYEALNIWTKQQDVLTCMQYKSMKFVSSMTHCKLKKTSFKKDAVHCKKELAIFPSPAGMSLTKLSGREKTKLFPPRKSLISDIPAGDGKMANSFLQCIIYYT